MAATIDSERCNGCGLCEPVCPGDIIFTDEASGLAEVRYPDECWFCGACLAECPTEAISYSFPEEIFSRWNQG